jgi:YesN/AraC family two-component response regulator
MEQAKVLLVEDDPRISEVITLFLSETYEVRRAATGAEAIGILRREQVAAVLLDYRLPGRLSGLDVLAKVRSTHPRLPVIMMTGYGSELLVASALKLGISDYFTKPVNIDDILQSLRKILSPGANGQAYSTSTPLLPARSSTNVLDLSIQKLMKTIQLRAADDLSLADLARELGVSKYHLSYRFKKAVGVTFRSYLLRARIERAKGLLQDGHQSVTDVAFLVGFNDLARFDKLFKRDMGLTPSAYRAGQSVQRVFNGS